MGRSKEAAETRRIVREFKRERKRRKKLGEPNFAPAYLEKLRR